MEVSDDAPGGGEGGAGVGEDGKGEDGKGEDGKKEDGKEEEDPTKGSNPDDTLKKDDKCGYIFSENSDGSTNM